MFPECCESVSSAKAAGLLGLVLVPDNEVLAADLARSGDSFVPNVSLEGETWHIRVRVRV